MICTGSHVTAPPTGSSSFLPALRRALPLLFLLSLSTPALCAEPSTDTVSTIKIQAGERVSDWLLKLPPTPQSYLPGLIWTTPARKPEQQALKNRLLRTLTAPTGAMPSTHDASPWGNISRWLAAMPVTGRGVIAISDPFWLQAHPQEDPLLSGQDTLVIPSRPTTVTVLTEEGKRCLYPHRVDRGIKDYLAACLEAGADAIDTAWIIEPDGKVFRSGIAAWNAQTHNGLAPGAWIWAPRRDSPYTARFSDDFAHFLATLPLSPPLHVSAESLITPIQTLPLPLSYTPNADEPKAISPVLHNAAVTANDWGFIGLLQTPTARMAEVSSVRFQLSQVWPYTRGSVVFQPFDDIEAGFRYSKISNRPYGPASLSGNQSYTDKSIDLKYRLWRETAWHPELSMGLIDAGGTGLFASEYLVGSKRYGPWDLSLGLAWGYMAQRHPFKNPLSSLLGSAFDSRKAHSNETGTANTSSFFRGPAALFGGVQYQTPWAPWLLKLEFDSNNYRNEPLGNLLPAPSPINAAAVFRLAPGADFTLGWERGHRLMLGLTLYTQLDHLATSKLMDPPLPRLNAAAPETEPDWTRTAADIQAQTQWRVIRIEKQGVGLTITVDVPQDIYSTQRMDRALRILHRDSPASVRRFHFQTLNHGLPLSLRTVYRDSWLAQQLHHTTVAQSRHGWMPGSLSALTENHLDAPTEQKPAYTDQSQGLEFSLTPKFTGNYGGPNDFVLFQLAAQAHGQIRMGERTWVQGDIEYRLLDNYAQFDYDAPSGLARVRTDVRHYLTSSRITVPNLQATHVEALSDNQFLSLYGGALESMFAGIGAEWLYRPWHSPVAVGIDLNRVRQRGFKQDFSWRDYRVNTGHVTLYWSITDNLLAQLSTGQYLAKDRGITLDISRRFANGVHLGAYASKTNVSAAQFGEGRFDKGIYLSLPFDTIMPYSSTERANFSWKPLTRDGGARLNRSVRLYALTEGRSAFSQRMRPVDHTPISIVNPSPPLADSADSLPLDELFTQVAGAALRRKPADPSP